MGQGWIARRTGFGLGTFLALTLVGCTSDNNAYQADGGVADGAAASGSDGARPGSDGSRPKGDGNVVRSDSGAPVSDGSPTSPDSQPWPTKPCGFKLGDNPAFTIGGVSRRFFVEMINVPAGYQGKLPIYFAYHGLGSSAYSFRGWIDAVAQNKPFIKVTPHALTPSQYPVWDFKTDPSKSVDIKFFDEMIGCLNAEYKVDLNRIHALGFSMGGHWVDYLATHRGNVLASFAQASGGFFGFEKGSPLYFEWPAMDLIGKLTNRPAALVAWGGINDNPTGQFSFHDAALETIKVFRAGKLFVLACMHDKGHKWPPDGIAKFMFMFFEDHPKGVNPEPYAKGPPSTTPFTGTSKAWPTWCSVAP
ncbi:MAG: hypothetical protein IT371_03495 [Deltaproteobacteria bacterium]|nr:hypothetical protein [Deltaproteobacteria bacterium]